MRLDAAWLSGAAGLSDPAGLSNTAGLSDAASLPDAAGSLAAKGIGVADCAGGAVCGLATSGPLAPSSKISDSHSEAAPRTGAGNDRAGKEPRRQAKGFLQQKFVACDMIIFKLSPKFVAPVEVIVSGPRSIRDRRGNALRRSALTKQSIALPQMT
jgi:hypothetical protein